MHTRSLSRRLAFCFYWGIIERVEEQRIFAPKMCERMDAQQKKRKHKSTDQHKEEKENKDYWTFGMVTLFFNPSLTCNLTSMHRNYLSWLVLLMYISWLFSAMPFSLLTTEISRWEGNETLPAWIKKDLVIYFLQSILPMCLKKQLKALRGIVYSSCSIVEGSQRLASWYVLMKMISRTLFFDLPLSFILFHYVYALRMNRQNAANGYKSTAFSNVLE